MLLPGFSQAEPRLSWPLKNSLHICAHIYLLSCLWTSGSWLLTSSFFSFSPLWQINWMVICLMTAIWYFGHLLSNQIIRAYMGVRSRLINLVGLIICVARDWPQWWTRIDPIWCIVHRLRFLSLSINSLVISLKRTARFKQALTILKTKHAISSQ